MKAPIKRCARALQHCEYVPLIVTGPRVRAGIDLGTRSTFADVGQTLAEALGVGRLAHGTSFLQEIRPAP